MRYGRAGSNGVHYTLVLDGLAVELSPRTACFGATAVSAVVLLSLLLLSPFPTSYQQQSHARYQHNRFKLRQPLRQVITTAVNSRCSSTSRQDGQSRSLRFGPGARQQVKIRQCPSIHTYYLPSWKEMRAVPSRGWCSHGHESRWRHQDSPWEDCSARKWKIVAQRENCRFRNGCMLGISKDRVVQACKHELTARWLFSCGPIAEDMSERFRAYFDGQWRYPVRLSLADWLETSTDKEYSTPLVITYYEKVRPSYLIFTELGLTISFREPWTEPPISLRSMSSTSNANRRFAPLAFQLRCLSPSCRETSACRSSKALVAVEVVRETIHISNGFSFPSQRKDRNKKVLMHASLTQAKEVRAVRISCGFSTQRKK